MKELWISFLNQPVCITSKLLSEFELHTFNLPIEHRIQSDSKLFHDVANLTSTEI